jgi:hypothetical protein
MSWRPPPCGLRPEQKPTGGPLGELSWSIAISLHECLRLGRYPWWWKLHLGLWRAYRGWHPNDTLGALPAEEQRDTLAYGETPAYTVTRVLAMCRQHFPRAQSLLDLGAGRGTLALTAAATGWDVLAVEYLQELVLRSEPVGRRHGWPVQWLHGDFLTLSLPRCDIIHVAATAFSDQTRQALADRWIGECDPGQGLLLQDWILDDERFEPLIGVRLPVTWGCSYFTLHRLRGPSPRGSDPARMDSTPSPAG